MGRIWILLTGILMLFSQVKAGELATVVKLPVEPTPTVTMEMRQVSLLEILQELEKQTGIFFSYESSMLDDFPKMSFKAQDESLSYCLRRLFYSLPVTYRMTGQIVILKRKPRLYTISGFVTRYPTKVLLMLRYSNAIPGAEQQQIITAFTVLLCLPGRLLYEPPLSVMMRKRSLLSYPVIHWSIYLYMLSRHWGRLSWRA